MFPLGILFIKLSIEFGWRELTNGRYLDALWAPLGVFMGLFMIFYSVFLVMHFHRQIALGRKVIVIDQIGIFDKRYMAKQVPWSEVKEIRRVILSAWKGPSAEYAVLSVENPEPYTKRDSWIDKLIRFGSGAVVGGDFQISFAGLSYDFDDFLEEAASTGQPVATAALEKYRD